MTIDEPRRRGSDRGWITRAWDWIDERDVDKHAVSWAILYGTVVVTRWAQHYAEVSAGKNGVEVAAVIAAVLVPYMALQGAAIKWYFEARS